MVHTPGNDTKVAAISGFCSSLEWQHMGHCISNIQITNLKATVIFRFKYVKHFKFSLIFL